MKVYYYGCQDSRSGHFLWAGEWYPAKHDLIQPPTLMKCLDGGFVPHTYEEGRYRLSNVGPWSILAWPDYSIDTRPGSHSTFIVDEGNRSAMGIVQAARASFPSVFKRLRLKWLTPFDPNQESMLPVSEIDEDKRQNCKLAD